MKQEMLFPLTEQQIFDAEDIRVNNPKGAAEATHIVAEFTLDNFPQLPIDDQTRFLMALRINAVSLRALAKSSWKAPTVAHYLGEIRRGIVNVYYHPDIKEASRSLDRDTKDNPYDFDVEMLDDEVEYMITVAALLGRSDLLSTAVDKMDILARVPTEPTRATLNRFKRNRVSFKQDPSNESYLALKATYLEAVSASKVINRWERASTVAARMSWDAFKSRHPLDGLKSATVCAMAAIKQRSTWKILFREIGKEWTEENRHAKWWETTPPGTNYSYLQLPK